MQAQKTCAVAPCISYLWQTGPWSICANGKSTRSIQCLDSHAGNATDEVSYLRYALLYPCMPDNTVPEVTLL